MPGYGTDDGATAYWAAAGYTVPAGTIAAARQRGSVYLDGTYGVRFPGVPAGGYAQERAWPRSGAVDYYGNDIPADVIPDAVTNASYEAALIELQAPGSLSVTTTPGKVKRRVRVEGAVEVEYAVGSGAGSVADQQPIAGIIEGMLRAFLVEANVPGAMVV